MESLKLKKNGPNFYPKANSCMYLGVVEYMLSFSNYSNAHHRHSHLQATSNDTLG